MEIFFWIFVIGAVLSSIGFVVWIVFFVWLAGVAIGKAERDLNRMLLDLNRMLSQVPKGDAKRLNRQQQAQIAQLFMQAQTQMGQLDDLARQRYDTRMGDLMGMAANAGIDWEPPPY